MVTSIHPDDARARLGKQLRRLDEVANATPEQEETYIDTGIAYRQQQQAAYTDKELSALRNAKQRLTHLLNSKAPRYTDIDDVGRTLDEARRTVDRALSADIPDEDIIDALQRVEDELLSLASNTQSQRDGRPSCRIVES